MWFNLRKYPIPLNTLESVHYRIAAGSGTGLPICTSIYYHEDDESSFLYLQVLHERYLRFINETNKKLNVIR
jgi:hypothetical protein